jgi:hypothetical protein
MSAREWYQFKAEESRAIAEELSNLDCKMKMLRNAAMWEALSRRSFHQPNPWADSKVFNNSFL